MGRYYDHSWYSSGARSSRSVFLVELFGTAMLSFSIALLLAVCPVDTLVPLAIGGLLISICNICGDLSGAHFNPCITLAIYAVVPTFTLQRCVLYLLAEIFGAIGGFNLAAWFCTVLKNPFSLIAHNELYSVTQILVCEAIFTAMLVLTCLRCAILTSTPNPLTSVWIAGAVVVASYAGGPISGACLNPALALGFSTRQGSWADLVVYAVGPLAGTLAAVSGCIALDNDIWLRRTGFATERKTLAYYSAPGRPLDPSDQDDHSSSHQNDDLEIGSKSIDRNNS